MQATERSTWQPDSNVGGTRRFIEYAKRFLSLASSEDEEAFAERLARTLCDFERSELIFSQYKRLLSRAHFSEGMRADFEFWLIRKASFVGSRFYDHDLIYQDLPSLAASPDFREAFSEFVAAINPPDFYPTAKKVTILIAGQAGGGHTMPAEATRKHLREMGHEVQLLDVDLLESSTLPTVDNLSHAQIYEEIYQREQNPLLAAEFSRYMREKQSVQDMRYLGLAKKAVLQFQASHIFSFAHHRPELSYLSYQLGIPMTIVHTDYLFQQSLLPLLVEQARLKKGLVSFTCPTAEFSFFERLFEKLHVQKELPLSVMQQFRRVDFPVRDSYQPLSHEVVQALREQLKIAPDATVVKLAMGQSGIPHLIEKIAAMLVTEKKSTPLHLFVICGTNSALKSSLQAALQSTKDMQLTICGFLPENEMAAIDQVADVWITKPGGSTSAELLCMQKQMLYILDGDHPWERANALFLETMQLAAPLALDQPLLRQIEQRVEVYTVMDRTTIPPTAWKKQINKIIL